MSSVRYAPTDFRLGGLFERVLYVPVTRPNLPQASLAEVVALKDRPAGKPLTVRNIGPSSFIHLIGLQLHQPWLGVAGQDSNPFTTSSC